jgi:hypothetical protein
MQILLLVFSPNNIFQYCKIYLLLQKKRIFKRIKNKKKLFTWTKRKKVVYLYGPKSYLSLYITVHYSGRNLLACTGEGRWCRKERCGESGGKRGSSSRIDWGATASISWW